MLISKIDLKNNPKIVFIANLLKPYTQRAYLVGGSVRDILLGLNICDYDIEIYDIDPDTFNQLMNKIGATGVGKSFFVYRLKEFDLALARSENKIGYGHKGFEVQICTEEKRAAKRRDFTINALMINIFTNEFLDFYGGVRDLESRILRHIDSESFQQDSLRVLRALSFVARFNLHIDPKSLQLMKSMDISDLSKERINSELYKFFQAQYLSLGFFYLQKLNLEKQIFYYENSQVNEEFYILLENARQFIKDEGLFLYLYLNYFHLDKKLFFANTRLKKELLKKTQQPYFKDFISDDELAFIALHMPLKKWLGLWNAERVEKAKKIGLFECKFESKITGEHIKKQGFSSKMIGLELENARKNELKEYLKKVKNDT
ncbi:CCA tRNA nucleotidyltransferase [Campylobacter sp. MIT 21-1685]|uniref:CCA tRNA nucleotidyltransferase n=1 Tax=unclassified Campylobacter TaxID=2593542 RepID=UPI00224B8B4B|nr:MULTISPECIES: CCA tRNA nucleotidyltransferase [unclassified Campylobacter]MCX2682739.1 CCA tRNA nucleotidyltransferase [Campylobacter sp. MIT 21-1684]MCX2751115.1 CCA tRNA nucleotidyltransferase [Campylobacter sp. MIT 21-1682]MCX2807220.1 CCA tRNA nucleotidyltransferase [Campylobacter sp. MIT 21-1685]